MSFIISENQNAPEGFRRLTDEEISQEYLSFDRNKDFLVSKNEWMFAFIKMLMKDIKSIEEEGPDSFTQKIKEISDEFDKYDKNGSKYLEYEECRNILINKVYISE